MASPTYTVPPTSSPGEIYRDLLKEVKAGDRNSSKIKDNRAGIRRGANIKKKMGLITIQQYKEIISAVNSAPAAEFRPLIYLIPYQNVAGLLQPAPFKKKAHPFSQEFIIERLARTDFDIIEF